MKNKIFKIILIIIGVAALLTVFIVAKNYYDGWRQSKLPGFQIQKIYEEAAKNDIWGGKTPQETYEMFIAALQKGDIDLASKYFAGLEGKGRAKKWLAEKQQKGEMEKYISELPKWEEMREDTEYWDKDGKNFAWERYHSTTTEDLPDGAGGFIRKEWPAGYYKYDVAFYPNVYHKNIWKITENILFDN